MNAEPVTKQLYETDFVEWADQTAELILAGRFHEIDAENLADEVASLARAERKSVRSQLQRLMMHKIKQQLQPEKDSQSWRGSIADARQELLDDLNACDDEKYLSPNNVAEVKQQGWHVLKLINGYLRYLRDSKTGSTLGLHEDPISYGDSDEDLERWLASLPIHLN